MNVVNDPSFELGTDWVYKNGASRFDPVGIDAADGDYIAACTYVFPYFGSGAISQPLSLSVGDTYDVSLWINHNLAQHGSLSVKIDPGDGNLTTLATWSADQDDWLLWEVGSFEALGSSGQIQIQRSGPLTNNAGWFVDLVNVETEDEVKTTQIKTALIADLNAINGTGIFSTTVVEVGREPKKPGDAKKPGLYLGTSSGVAALAGVETLGDASQSFGVHAVIQSDTPNADMDTFLDDVRNAVERSNGNLRGLSWVVEATVTGWTGLLTAPGIHKGLYYREIEITVVYHYNRGSA